MFSINIIIAKGQKNKWGDPSFSDYYHLSRSIHVITFLSFGKQKSFNGNKALVF